MIGVLRVCIVLLMTRHAGDRSPAEAVIRVTRVARNAIVRPPCLKLRPIVIEARLPCRSALRVTFLAIGTEPGLPVIDCYGGIVFVDVASCARAACAGELQSNMTAFARRAAVLPYESE